MFVRIDKDLFVNIQNMFSYKLSDEGEAIKLSIFGNTGNIIHNIFYLKDMPEQMSILYQFNETMKDLTVNPEIIKQIIQPNENEEFDENVFNEMEENREDKHIKETIENIEE